MKRLLLGLAIVSLVMAPAFAAKKKARGAKAGAKAAGPWKKTPGLYAKFHTSHGDFVCQLFEKEAPETVAAFSGLAIGDKEYVDPKDGETKKGRFYDGLTFHRVVADYIIQGGDPKGDSTGGPGWQFDDEINGLKFDRPGRLAMANSGPNTNGSQFFITINPVDKLDDAKSDEGKIISHYTIFGQVVEGQKVVDAISQVKTVSEKPEETVTIEKLDIVRVKKGGKMSTVKPSAEPAGEPTAKAPVETGKPAADVATDETAAQPTAVKSSKKKSKRKKKSSKKKATPAALPGMEPK